MAFKIPSDFKFPEQATFDGTGDPREHLLSYQAKMQVLGVRDPVMCRAFLPTLKGSAQRWLVAQPSGSIHNFEELADRFMSHYAANIKPQKDLTHLGDIRQDEGESLKTYLARWQKEIHTEECFYLKKIMEGIIQQGTPPPNQWRRRPGSRGDEEPVAVAESGRGKQPVSGEEEAQWRQKPIINMIVGGPEGGDSANTRKAWARQLYVGTVYGREENSKKVCREPIVFTDRDLPAGEIPHRDALVIAMDVNGIVVRRILVDTGSSVNVLYLETFTKMGLTREQLNPVKTPLAGFTGDSVETEGSITLPVEIGTYPDVQQLSMKFIVVDLACSHNAILGRPGLEDLGALISIEHLCLKFRTPNGIGTVRCDRKVARDCYLQACRGMGKREMRIHEITERPPKKTILPRPEPAVELEEVEIDSTRPDRRVLREHRTVFAWGPEDMPGVDRSIISHKLAVDPEHRPVVQKKRYLANDRREFVKKEVGTLLAAGHVREVKYPEWLANVVLVPKPPAWRMCVDYTDLNKACPKDPFPLPRIDQLVDETAGSALLSFIDAFRGYHQIFMHPADEEKTAFLTPDGVYYYRVMPFGLKNAGATYTRMVARLFQHLLGKSMAAYVDDMLVKSQEEDKYAEDLADCFKVMMKYNLRLNPKKCAFAVQGGKFLGYMVTKRGIEPNPEKVQAIIDMQPPTTVRDLQRLTGRLAALSRFLSKAADKTIPFFEAIKKKEGFAWTAECQQSFEELKQYLSTPPVLSTPQVDEPLFLYLAASAKAVSSVLVREDDRVQHPVYYVSRSLKAAETRYTIVEKIVYALVVTVRKLAPYFQAHTVRVLTDQPLGSVLRNPLSSGRLVKWAVELTQYGIEYQPRPSIKGQALADFLVECTASEEEKEHASEGCPGEWWEMQADGASSRQHCGGGVMLITPEGFRLYYALRYRFSTSNNEAEYEAVLNGLRLAKALGVERLRIKTDSRLVVGQISGTCETKNAKMALYKERAVEMLKGFVAYEIEYIPRTDNTEADLLSKIALEGVPDHLIKTCQKEELHQPSVGETPPEVQQIDLGEWDRGKNPKMFWIEDIRRFIEKGELPEDPGAAAKVRRKAPSFRIIDGQLYKQSFGGPLLKCGVCQAFARKDTRPATFYTPVTTAIPFAKWGIDLLGPLPVAPGGLKFCVVAIDYFTKWVEAEPLATITEYQCRRFLWKRVICRFGLPEHIVSDNGRQFDCQAFADFCRRHGIKHTKVSVAYPQANGQVENVNRTLVDGIRKKLEDI
ncbi:PREDICTED: uncharacterized protein LOC109156332 [Ipomoea nil]|uniref:uncharacterized protein LOC109156332 n=1 Tax=Ipomoea nil TaxID=35883 RepID=UPI00090140C1|nr:PREDICTED: uncharacterized protein LOC109156332 [Ipomoea nil]